MEYFLPDHCSRLYLAEMKQYFPHVMIEVTEEIVGNTTRHWLVIDNDIGYEPCARMIKKYIPYVIKPFGFFMEMHKIRCILGLPKVGDIIEDNVDELNLSVLEKDANYMLTEMGFSKLKYKELPVYMRSFYRNLLDYQDFEYPMTHFPVDGFGFYVIGDTVIRDNEELSHIKCMFESRPFLSIEKGRLRVSPEFEEFDIDKISNNALFFHLLLHNPEYREGRWERFRNAFMTLSDHTDLRIDYELVKKLI